MSRKNHEQDCDKEQIQYIDLIQPIGALFAFDAQGTIQFAASNDSDYRTDWLGRNARELLDASYQRLVQVVEGRSEPTTPQLVRMKTTNTWMSVVAHKVDELTIVELEP